MKFIGIGGHLINFKYVTDVHSEKIEDKKYALHVSYENKVRNTLTGFTEDPFIQIAKKLEVI